MLYLQCNVFLEVCALIDFKLVIPCDVNGDYELWGSAGGCWPILNQCCIATDACASFNWRIFPDKDHLALGLILCPSLDFSFVDSDLIGWLL